MTVVRLVPSPVIPVLDTGIQESLLVYKQTSIESGYNVFDEIAGRLDPSVKHWDDTLLAEVTLKCLFMLAINIKKFTK
ncbi:hypothetical protein [Wolbachia endosymbiont (group A) of Anomoia purmunda]|uniref:hypothetical protein n=1 Tax=Wolbachia endosymbiont (group A) of Anomoia purmunda TaxID=2953978 RepID=UPI00222E1CF4|nr:hypothetical protein [Wolbachia endosymbiont (group A) of Anomoia purmunda]